MSQEQQNREPVVVERVQTGVRLEKRMLKVLKASPSTRIYPRRSAGRDRPSRFRRQGSVFPANAEGDRTIQGSLWHDFEGRDSHNLRERKK